jgi:hypothetical protein
VGQPHDEQGARDPAALLLGDDLRVRTVRLLRRLRRARQHLLHLQVSLAYNKIVVNGHCERKNSELCLANKSSVGLGKTAFLSTHKYGSVTMTQSNIYVLEGGASNQVYRIIGQKFFLE